MYKNYLFIAGCPRSGTSALARLIGNHSKVVMGMERYGHLVLPNNFSLSESHFKPMRFFDMREGDTFYDNFDNFHKWCPDIREKLLHRHLDYVGDKRPDLYLVLDELFREFPTAKLLFIYRNVFDVAESWQKRAEEGVVWPREKNYKRAVESWSLSLNSVLSSPYLKNQIVCVRYEDIFNENVDISPLYDALNLSFDDRSREAYTYALNVARSLRSKKSPALLTSENLEYIRERADFAAEKKMDEQNILRQFSLRNN